MKISTAVFLVFCSGLISGQGIIIDHAYVHPESIPQIWIDSVKINCKWHYAHTSHGGQLTIGLNDYEVLNPFFNVAIGSCNLPNVSGALCIHDGQVNQTYITPDLYWQSTDGMNATRAVLSGNPSLNFSAWSWCTQVDGYNESQIQEYLDSISKLELEFPGVTFIYMTGNAQATGSSGYNRFLRNNQIRQYCIDNNKVLFDFADLDCWWYNDTTGLWEHNVYVYDTHLIPVEHPAFNGSYGGHTTYASCQQKGYAVWYMFAVLNGWEPSSVEEGVLSPVNDYLQCRVFPNPFTDFAEISFNLKKSEFVEIKIFNVLGRCVQSIFEGSLGEGDHSFSWDGTCSELKPAENGVYFYKIIVSGNESSFGELIYLK